LRGGEHVAFLDAAIADRPHRRRSEEDRAGRDGAPPDVGLAADVDDLRHASRWGPALFLPRVFVKRFWLGEPGPSAAKGVVKSRRRTGEALSTDHGAPPGCVRNGMRAAKGWAR